MKNNSIIQGFHWLRDPYGYLDRRADAEGPTFYADLPMIGRVLLTGDPELIRAITLHPRMESGKGIVALRAILGDKSLIMLDGQPHAERRKRVAPLFRGRKLTEFDLPTVEATRRVLGAIAPGKVISIYDAALRISLSMIIHAIFGPLPENEERSIALRIEAFLHSFRNPLNLFVRSLQIDLGPWSPWGRALRNRDALRALIQSRLHLARQTGCGGFLGMLAADSDTDSSLSDPEITDEILALLVFGHDTAASAMAWAFANIYSRPAILQRIREEGMVYQAGSTILNPDQLPYLGACLNEGLRLTPVVVHLTRVAGEDLRIGDYSFRRGEKIFPCMYLAHRNPAVFENPAEFRPERFLNDPRHDFAFFPFGLGARTCVGQPFALRQMMLILSTAVLEYDLSLAPGYKPVPSRRMVLIIPEGGTRMIRTETPG